MAALGVGEGWERLGSYHARLEEPFRTVEIRQALSELVSGREIAWVRCGRLFVFRVPGTEGARGRQFLVQPFPAARGLAPWVPGGGVRGGPACAVRAVESARRLLGRAVHTPRPVACLVRPAGRWHGEGLAVFQMQPGLRPLQEWLAQVLAEQHDFGLVRAWARAVGAAVHDLHEAGVSHGNLDGWSVWVDTRREPHGAIYFTELERCVIGAAPGPFARLRDWAALDLPPRLLAEALDAGLGDAADPFLWRCLQAQRHGLRAWRFLRGYPAPPPVNARAAFLWDASHDEVVSLRREDTRPVLSPGSVFPLFFVTLSDRGLFAEPEALSHRVAIGVRAVSETLVQDVAAVGRQGFRDVWIRLCCHDSDERRAYALATIQNLAKAGFSVSVLLVQDRLAIQDQERWVGFVMRALEPVGWQVRRAVYGFAPDETAWGFRSVAEYRRFLEPLQKVRLAYPGIAFTGPACSLANTRFLARTAVAVGHVGNWESCVCRVPVEWMESPLIRDRAWLRWLARFDCTARRRVGASARPILIVEAAKNGWGDQGAASEPIEMQVARCVRRTILAVCSGLIEQVVLMQQAQSGVVSQHVTQYDAWRIFMRRLGHSGRFVGLEPVEGSGSVWLLRFEDAVGKPVWMGWSEGEAQIVTAAITVVRAGDLLERTAPLLPSPRLRLTAMPAYFE